MSYTPVHKIRLVTAAALFDGHDAAINIMRRIMQSKGAEIIHLGHNRSVAEIVECAIEEDVQGIAITSYQGGHIEFFKYMKDLLEANGCGHIRLFGGGGGTILPQEIEELQRYGITRIYSPDDGRRMGLEGMIEDVIRQCDFALNGDPGAFGGKPALGEWKDIRKVARAISNAENGTARATEAGAAPGTGRAEAGRAPKSEGRQQSGGEGRKPDSATKAEWRSGPAGERSGGGANAAAAGAIPVVGITGTGGAGKSSVTDELVRRYLNAFADKTIAVISVDPSKKKTGGALLGDRIRMNAIAGPRAYMRSLATRDSDRTLSVHVQEAVDICKAAGYDLVMLESAGVGQSDASILDHCDVSVYVMTPEYGAASQLEKINMLDYADLIVLNKFDKAGALDALHDIRKQYKRNHGLWTAGDGELPVVGTIAAQFNDAGINELFEKLVTVIGKKTGVRFGELTLHAHVQDTTTQSRILPPSRVRYLAEICGAIREYNRKTEEQSVIATKLYQLDGVLAGLPADSPARAPLLEQKAGYERQLYPLCKKLVDEWPALVERYRKDDLEYDVRGKIIRQPLFYESLSGTAIPRIAVPRFRDWGEILRWRLQENFPGKYPYTAGVFPLKRSEEDPTRMFAGEGGPERTNKRFHYVSADQPAKRLSTAFDSVTLYGEDPDYRPDIFGKIGNSGVSIATVDDAKKLYSGFDLCDPRTSVSMTINGPAPILLAFFMNAAIDQQCEKHLAGQGAVAGANIAGQRGAGAPGAADEPKDAVAVAFARKYGDGAGARPAYHNPAAPGALPAGNNGLGLGLLGLSGDEVLLADEYDKIRRETLAQVRGTVQADILKEDQAQNTCIFSTEFALRLMGDVQAYFIEQGVRNFYSVSISGYHIAEAGANPITQLAFTLANGFTYVEYYLSRGMKIDDFAPNLSFFFSNGMDPEYSVIGRVARRIWAKAIKHVYKGNGRSQKLKYHIQTSGRSLHAQEIDFNDIRTTLQALYAIYDNCNSLHTNAYDEAITTPTEESVRRAMAIQLIINRELGTTRTENFIQGSFAIEELTDLVEEAVLAEFDRLNDRGGVLGAMERMYQRNKIQEESLYYESAKHSGELPIVGVNTFLAKNGSPTVLPGEVIRSTKEEKDQQIGNLEAFKARNNVRSAALLQRLKEVAVTDGNLFAELMETVKYCSLGEITNALYEVGGQYRRNM
ncbi:MAG TPA: methylmalonyl-CoA mutase family protein [Puia sp.]|nr:methylmalonyl-CoA mutase family protein [Puia sp.]